MTRILKNVRQERFRVGDLRKRLANPTSILAAFSQGP